MKFEFRKSRLGTGAFAAERIQSGDSIKFLTGEILGTKDVLRRIGSGKARRDDPLQIDDDLYILVDDTSLYFNHSCEPSAAIRGHNELFAYRTIEVDEEITFDYSTVVGMTALNAAWTMRCACASAKCRELIGSVSSIPIAELKEYAYRGALPDFIIRQCVQSRVAHASN
jgi:uncharacterized protein